MRSFTSSCTKWRLEMGSREILEPDEIGHVGGWVGVLRKPVTPVTVTCLKINDLRVNKPLTGGLTKIRKLLNVTSLSVNRTWAAHRYVFFDIKKGFWH